MHSAFVKHKSYAVRQHASSLQNENDKNKSEKTQEGAGAYISSSESSKGNKIFRGDSTSALTDEAIKKLEKRLKSLGLFPARESETDQDLAFTKTLYSLELSLLESQNKNTLLQKKLTDIEKGKDEPDVIQEKSNHLELENLNLVSMFNLVQARLSEVYARFCGDSTSTKHAEETQQSNDKTTEVKSTEMLKLNLMVSQQTVNDLQKELKAVTADLKHFKYKELGRSIQVDGEENVQFLKLTINKLHGQIEDLTIQIKELTGSNSFYDNELQAANKAITGYRNTSVAKRFKGLCEKQRLEYERKMVTLEQQVKEKDSENEAKTSRINELTLKYEDMKKKVNKYKTKFTAQQVESAELLQLNRLQLQIEIKTLKENIGKKDFESAARQKQIEDLERANDNVREELEKVKETSSNAYKRASKDLVKVKGFYEKQRTSYEVKILSLEKQVNTQEIELQELKVELERCKHKFEQDIVGKDKIIHEVKQSLWDKVEYIGRGENAMHMAVQKIKDLQTQVKQSTDSMKVLHQKATDHEALNQRQLEKINDLQQNASEEKCKHQMEIEILRQELNNKNDEISSLKYEMKLKEKFEQASQDVITSPRHPQRIHVNCLKKVEKIEAYKYNFAECKTKKTHTLETRKHFAGKIMTEPMQTTEFSRCFQLVRYQTTTTKVIYIEKTRVGLCPNLNAITANVNKIAKVDSQYNAAISTPKSGGIKSVYKPMTMTTGKGHKTSKAITAKIIKQIAKVESQDIAAIGTPKFDVIKFVDNPITMITGKERKTSEAALSNEIFAEFANQDKPSKNNKKTSTGSSSETSSTTTSSDEMSREKKRRLRRRANKKAKKATVAAGQLSCESSTKSQKNHNKAARSNKKEASIDQTSSSSDKLSSSSSEESIANKKKRYRARRRSSTNKKAPTATAVGQEENIAKVVDGQKKSKEALVLSSENTGTKKKTRRYLKRGIKLLSNPGRSVSEMLSTINYPDRDGNSASSLTESDVNKLLEIASKEITIKKKNRSKSVRGNRVAIDDSTKNNVHTSYDQINAVNYNKQFR